MEQWEEAYVVQFAQKDRANPPRFGATRWAVMRSRALEWLGRFFKWLRFPGVIKEGQIDDSVSGHHIMVRVGLLFTCLSVNGRDYYFSRLSGKFDGTGSGR